jgi:catechol 2,3-dioxygenase-like lactoylglutathione lyase family enzyme
MNQAYVEHANVTVTNIEEAVRFLQTAIPSFIIRHQGVNGYRWCHIGTESSYIALQEQTLEAPVERTPYRQLGVNHVAFVVEDLHSLILAMRNAGYREGEVNELHPYRRRAYFFDHDGMEWEFVEYLSNQDTKRNDYRL